MLKTLALALALAVTGSALAQNAKPVAKPDVPAPVPIQAPAIQIQPGGIQIQIEAVPGQAFPVQGPVQVLPAQVAGQVEAPDLQKQIEDALKELDKIKDSTKPEETKKVVDDVQKKLRDQIKNNIGARPIVIGPGGIGGIGGVGGIGGGIIANPIARMNQNRLGITPQRPVPVLVEQLGLPEGKGMVVHDVLPDSAAAKAGIKKYDILLEIDGKAVSSDLPTFQKELREFKTDAEVKAVVMRAGVKESIKSLKMPEAKDDVIIRPGGVIRPGIQIIPPGGAGFGGAAGGAGAAGGGFGGVGGIGNIQVRAGNGEALAVAISDKDFSIESTSAGNKTTIRGTRADGKATPTEITVQEGETTVRANSVADLPERLRAGVNRLLENVK